MSYELRLSMRTLQKIQEAVGAGDSKKKNKEPDIDTSKMSEYEKGQYECAQAMKDIRETMAKVEEYTKTGPPASRIKASNEVRTQMATLKKKHQGLKEIARKEGKQKEYEVLTHHFKKTEEFKNRISAATTKAHDDDDDDPKGSPKLSSLGGDTSNLGTPMISIMDDEEFQVFFTLVKERDKMMDQSLDRLSQGLQRLHQSGTAIQDELKIQDKILDEIDHKVDKVQQELDTLNHRMKKVTEAVKADSCCMYIMFLLLLLGMAGAIYTMIFR
eukprot:NODE_5515_length_1004_cov_106.558456_g4942_i0.p1 GENE.NODE_5515_length_1004_cov_106.558456_g4942_i0~~NODE_5515_length_1004_cov_106.558456_g4942_i0.p1  ORF type:complete len:290 (+),score=57.11 NODE_5515_length_1004_cov_106.558456_g4942_i0:57-872(+)